MNEKDITINEFNSMLDSQKGKCKELSNGYDELINK